MFRLIRRQQKKFHSTNISGLLFVACALLLSDGSLIAQTTVYTDQYGNPTVTVDLRVLDKLGPQQNLAERYRKMAPLPSRPVMAGPLSTGLGNTRGGLLAPPPRRMPRSKINIPKTQNRVARKTHAVSPPGPTRLTSTKRVPRFTSKSPTQTRIRPAKSTIHLRPKTVIPPMPATARPTVAPPNKKLQLVKPPIRPLKSKAEPKSTASSKPPAPALPKSTHFLPQNAQPPIVSRKIPQIERGSRATTALPLKPTPPRVSVSKTAIRTAKRSTPPPTVKPEAKPKGPAIATVRPSTSELTSSITSQNKETVPKAGPAGPVSISRDGMLYSIPFASGSENLPGRAKPALDKLVAQMKKEKGLRIQLMGFAAGKSLSASQARRSSLFRALTVRKHLMGEGIRSTRMDIRALGKNTVEGVPDDRVDIVVNQ